jgi:hypothetical protein
MTLSYELDRYSKFLVYGVFQYFSISSGFSVPPLIVLLAMISAIFFWCLLLLTSSNGSLVLGLVYTLAPKALRFLAAMFSFSSGLLFRLVFGLWLYLDATN